MSKWNALFGLEHPEVYGKIKDTKPKMRKIQDTEMIMINLLIAIARQVGVKQETMERAVFE